MALTDSDILVIARQFLAGGAVEVADSDQLVAACAQVVREETQQSAASAVALARRFAKRAAELSRDAVPVANRALGWALLVGGQYDEARESYLKARRALVNQPVEQARIDRVLVDVYMYLDKFGEARRRARAALRIFEKEKQADEVAKTKVNFANLLHRQDRHREANAFYTEAAAHFRQTGNAPAMALCYFNQGNTLVQLFRFEEAARVYSEARDIFTKFGHSLHATGCLNGLAWLHMLQGDYNTALQELAECETAFKRMAQPREQVLCQLDRAEAYLGLNLYVDARNAAREGEANALKLGIRYEAAKGAFFNAKASYAMGRAAEARTALRRAAEGFGKVHNRAFQAAVELLAAQLDTISKSAYSRIKKARSGFARAQLPLWEAICDLQILSVWPDKPAIHQRLRQNSAVRAVPHLHARQYTLMGDREASRGHRSRAVAYWSKAADVLDAVRAKLPPVDMRSAFLRGQTDPYQKLIAAECDRDPQTAAAWSERFKTAGVWSVAPQAYFDNPARKRAEESLAALADQVTALANRIDGAGVRSGLSGRNSRSLQALKKRVRLDLAALDKGASSAVSGIGEIREQYQAVSRTVPIVQFHVSERDLYAFIHDRGTTRSVRYPEGASTARQLIAQWRFMVERQAYATGPLVTGDLADEQTLLSRTGSWLLDPLELDSRSNRLLVIPEGTLSNLPWHALEHAGRALAEQYSLLMIPSLQHYVHAERQRISSKRVEVFLGQSEDLTEARRDFLSFARCDQKQVTVHERATRQSWPSSGEARVWHFVGHANLRSDNPFYSSLLLHDGPLFAADFRLRQARVGLVTLAACRTAQQTMLPGEESSGLVRSLLEMGARNVLASHWAVADRATADWMETFYEHYFNGGQVAESVREAALTLRNRYPSAYHWAAFSVFGAG